MYIGREERKVYIQAGIWAIVGLAIGAVYAIIHPEVLGIEPRTPPAISQEQAPPVPSSLDQMRQAFGPWQLIDNNELGDYQSLALLRQNGTKELGSKHLQPGTEWQPSIVIDFQDVELHENYVLVRTTSGAVYRLPVQQPFVVEARPETVYAFASDGTVVAAPAVTILKEK